MAEQVARMMVAGMKPHEIAQELGYSYAGLQRIIQCPEYVEIETQVRKKMNDKMDEVLDRRAEMKKEVEAAVPEAIKLLLDAMREKHDLRAALELLDRDPKRDFVKASRSQPVEPEKTGISSEALASLVRDADLTHKIMQQASALDEQKPAEA
jgi:hypothetical protein